MYDNEMEKSERKKNKPIQYWGKPCYYVGYFLMLPAVLSFITLKFKAGLITFCISACVMFVGLIRDSLEQGRESECFVDNRTILQREYDEYAKKLGVVKSNTQGTLIQSNDFNAPQYLWIADGMLHMFPTEKYCAKYITLTTIPVVQELEITTIPLDSILYYDELGELYRYTVVSGGESRYDAVLEVNVTEPIKTKIVTEDNRSVELTYENSEGEIVTLEFEYDAYDAFKELMPMKDIRMIESVTTAKAKKTKKRSPSAKKRLKQLNELKKEGLITEEEYTKRKEKILDSITK